MTDEVDADALRRTARETGERIGAMDAIVTQHSVHFREINGSITEMAEKLGSMSTASAVMATSLANIERTLEHRSLNYDTRLTTIEAWVAENRGGSAVKLRSKGISLQWTLAIFAAGISTVLALFGAFISLVVLLANNVI